MSLKSVKNKIRSVDKTRQVTKAMEAVSAVKMRKSQEGALVARPYALAAMKILRQVSGNRERVGHPLMSKRKGGKVCFVVMTSDKGLAGSLNSAVLKECRKIFAAENIAKENIGIITIGKRGFDHFSKRGYTVVESYNGWGDFVDFERASPLVARIRTLYETEGYGEVRVVYTNFISTLKQEVYTRKVLPITFEAVEEMVHGILPAEGKYSKDAGEQSAPSPRQVRAVPRAESRSGTGVSSAFSFEPDADTVLAQLIPLLLKIQVYHSVLEAIASEHSARMIAMKNASDNAGEIVRQLNLKYNKVRQASITQEMNEIVSNAL